MECSGGWAERYRLECVGAGNYTACTWAFQGLDYISYCAWVDDEQPRKNLPGEGGGGGSGSYEPIYIDCNGVINGEAYFDWECETCVGGTTGIAGCQSLTKEIIDSVKNPCLKAQVTAALTAKTTIQSMLNSTFGGTVLFEDLELKIRDTTNLLSTTDAEMQRRSPLSFEIRLNQDKLPNTSKEYILSTIYHEILHAYLESKLLKGPGGTYLNIDQHEIMATKYVTLLSGALKIAFPSLSDNEAWALSWGGLESTPFYMTRLTVTQRTQITNLNDRHKSKDAINRLGNYCP